MSGKCLAKLENDKTRTFDDFVLQDMITFEVILPNVRLFNLRRLLTNQAKSFPPRAHSVAGWHETRNFNGYPQINLLNKDRKTINQNVHGSFVECVRFE